LFGSPNRHEATTRHMAPIRLTRPGSRNTPYFHVVVTDHRRRQGSKGLVQVGSSKPKARQAERAAPLDHHRTRYWVAAGAQQAERVSHLVRESRKQALVAAG